MKTEEERVRGRIALTCGVVHLIPVSVFVYAAATGTIGRTGVLTGVAFILLEAFAGAFVLIRSGLGGRG